MILQGLADNTALMNAPLAVREQVILVVDDEVGVREFLRQSLRGEGYAVECASNYMEALDFLPQACLVLADMKMPGRNGIDLIREIRRTGLDVPVIVCSGLSTPSEAAEAIKSGADDFLGKPFHLDQLRAMVHKKLRARAIPAVSPMSEIEASLNQVADSDTPVLLRGESGVGKEVLARKIHLNSPRSAKPFIKLNCAALPSELLETELFGHERGAFTGADQAKPGIFELAEGGTILLDEIGDMDVRLQAKLLQVLQDHEFRRVGGKELLRVNVRILSATHRDLEQRIVDGDFREDLFYRLNVIAIRIPPLRERREEILPLARSFWNKYGAERAGSPEIPALLQKALLDYHWPGNIRELENVVRRFLVLENADAIATELRRVRRPGKSAGREAPAPSATIRRGALAEVEAAGREAETQLILSALHSARWNRRKAAVALNIDYRSLLYKIKKLSIDDRPAT
jgi:two-component system response regulator AtoC